MKAWLALVFVLMIGALGASLWPVPATAADPPLFIKGRAYIFVWDCLPQWVPELTSAITRQEHIKNPCFTESLTVTAVRANGWVDVTDPQDGNRHWWVNPARAIAIQLREPESRASR